MDLGRGERLGRAGRRACRRPGRLAHGGASRRLLDRVLDRVLRPQQPAEFDGSEQQQQQDGHGQCELHCRRTGSVAAEQPKIARGQAHRGSVHCIMLFVFQHTALHLVVLFDRSEVGFAAVMFDYLDTLATVFAYFFPLNFTIHRGQRITRQLKAVAEDYCSATFHAASHRPDSYFRLSTSSRSHKQYVCVNPESMHCMRATAVEDKVIAPLVSGQTEVGRSPPQAWNKGV